MGKSVGWRINCRISLLPCGHIALSEASASHALPDKKMGHVIQSPESGKNRCTTILVFHPLYLFWCDVIKIFGSAKSAPGNSLRNLPAKAPYPSHPAFAHFYCDSFFGFASHSWPFNITCQ